MVKGNQPTDGGHFILNKDEMNLLIGNHPNSSKFIKKLIGSNEFLNGKERWCIWIEDNEISEAQNIHQINERINKVAKFRKESKSIFTQEFSKGSHRFIQIQSSPKDAIIIPKVSSDRREYIPLGFVSSNFVITDLAFAVYNPSTYLMSILSSKMHMCWVKVVAGRLGTGFRYSNAICYNTFPFPTISKQRKEELTQCTLKIIDERLKHSEKTLAQLYDPDKMPEGLKEAHHQNDLAVERCYRSTPFNSDEERLEYLFKLYEKMIQEEKDKDTLFAKQKKTRKRK
jgi:hypothetical protein